MQKGDRVFVFLPKTPACYISILAIIKIGAIAAPLFEAFMDEAVKNRINDCEGSLLITDSELVKRVHTDEIPSLQTILLAGGRFERREAVHPTDLVEWVGFDDGICDPLYKWIDRQTERSPPCTSLDHPSLSNREVGAGLKR